MYVVCRKLDREDSLQRCQGCREGDISCGGLENVWSSWCGRYGGGDV